MNHKTIVKCPFCGAEETSKTKFSGKMFAISFLLLGFPLPFINNTYHCFDCGLDFKKQKKKKIR
jgi:DNA-directed RNA polymerase subunit RPC12/RpoP